MATGVPWNRLWGWVEPTGFLEAGLPLHSVKCTFLGRWKSSRALEGHPENSPVNVDHSPCKQQRKNTDFPGLDLRWTVCLVPFSFCLVSCSPSCSENPRTKTDLWPQRLWCHDSSFSPESWSNTLLLLRDTSLPSGIPEVSLTQHSNGKTATHTSLRTLHSAGETKLCYLLLTSCLFLCK